MYIYPLPPSSLTPSLTEYFADLFSWYLAIKTQEVTGFLILIDKQKIHQEKLQICNTIFTYIVVWKVWIYT